MKSKRERIFYLDFIRAIATLLIVLTHYNALYIYNANRPQAAIITLHIGNIYIGSFGVSLFLIISGAAMMYIYGNIEKVNWKNFYHKRFITIYPIFWIAYLIVGFITFFEQKGINPTIPRKNFVFTVIGFDSYLMNFGIKTFCHIGEWFLGLIILIYIVFPLFLKLIKHYPVIFALGTLIVYISSLILFKNKSWCGTLLTVRMPEFIFGMYFIKYIKKVPWYIALISFIVIVANQFVKPAIIDSNIQVAYIGICGFLILTYIADFVKWNTIKNICSTICKYSYPCFIIHHWLIYKIALTFDLNTITKFNSYLLFFGCCIAIAFSSYFLYKINNKVLTYLKIK